MVSIPFPGRGTEKCKWASKAASVKGLYYTSKKSVSKTQVCFRSKPNCILENAVCKLSFRRLFFKTSECELIFKHMSMKTSFINNSPQFISVYKSRFFKDHIYRIKGSRHIENVRISDRIYTYICIYMGFNS